MKLTCTILLCSVWLAMAGVPYIPNTGGVGTNTSLVNTNGTTLISVGSNGQLEINAARTNNATPYWLLGVEDTGLTPLAIPGSGTITNITVLSNAVVGSGTRAVYITNGAVRAVTFYGDSSQLTGINLNPLMFGGYGDGLHDDTLAMQACFTNANASINPVTVDLLNRSWLLNGTLLSTNTHFRLQNGTIYVTNGAVNPAIWLGGDFAEMSHIQLWGPGTNGYSGAGATNVGLYLGSYTNFSAPAIIYPEVIECDIRNFSTNVFGNHPVMGRLIDCNILCPGNTAVDVTSDQFTIDGCYIGVAGPPGNTVYGLNAWSAGPGPGNIGNAWSNAVGIYSRGGINLIVRNSNINGVHQALNASGTYSVEYTQNNHEMLVNGTTNSPIILLTNIYLGHFQQNVFQPNVGGTYAKPMMVFEINKCSNERIRIQSTVNGANTGGGFMSVYSGFGQSPIPEVSDSAYGYPIVIHTTYGDAGTTLTPSLSANVMNSPYFLGGAYFDWNWDAPINDGVHQRTVVGANVNDGAYGQLWTYNTLAYLTGPLGVDLVVAGNYGNPQWASTATAITQTNTTFNNNITVKGVAQIQTIDSLTNSWTANTDWPLGTNVVFTSTGATLGVTGVANRSTSTVRYGEMTLVASGGDVVFTNAVGIRFSDGLTSRTVTNGTSAEIRVKYIPGVKTNATISYHP